MGSGQSLCCNNNDARAREYKVSDIQKQLIRQENLKRIETYNYGMLQPTMGPNIYHSDNAHSVLRKKREGEKQLLEMLELTEEEKRSYKTINKKMMKQKSHEKRHKRHDTFDVKRSGKQTPPVIGNKKDKSLKFDSVIYIDNRNDENHISASKEQNFV